nr:verprolin-like [Lolium perenne]
MRVVVLYIPLQGIARGRPKSSPPSSFLPQHRRRFLLDSGRHRPPPPSSSRPTHPCNPPTVKLRPPPVGGAASSSSAPTRRTRRPFLASWDASSCRRARRLAAVTAPRPERARHHTASNSFYAFQHVSPRWQPRGRGPRPSAAPASPFPHLPAPRQHSLARASVARASQCLAFASSRIGSRSGDVRNGEFSDKFFCSFSQVRDDDVSKVTLPAWPGQGYGRHWLSSGLLVQFVSCPYSDVFDLLYDLDLCIVYLYLDSLESLL